MMPDTTKQAELAGALRAETKALVELEGRIGRLMRERRRLEMAFEVIAAAVDATFANGEASLALVDELDLMDQRLQRLEHDLTAAMESATKSFSSPKL